MGLDLWFQPDVIRLLNAVHETMASTASAVGRQSELQAAYRQGFTDALRALALAFGVSAPSSSSARPMVVDGDAERLVSPNRLR